MNPALQNYLQNQQQQSQSSQPYNPFDSGIQKAIASAKQSLGMSHQQEEDAFNKGLLAFGDAIAQTPSQKGFWNNLASAGRALTPGIRAYDDAEATSISQNQTLANEILKHDAMERQRQIEAEERAWRRQLAERQLGEQKRYHDMMYNGVGGSGKTHKNEIHGDRQITGRTKKEMEAEASNSELSSLLNNAKNFLTKDLESQKTYKGRFNNLISNFMPGGYIPTQEQAKVNAIGDVLRGKLFNKFGYRNQAEFEHVPSISADNPPEVNLQIIQTLKSLLDNPQLENQDIFSQETSPLSSSSTSSSQGEVLMQNRDGQRFYIPYDQVEAAIGDVDEPLTLVGE